MPLCVTLVVIPVSEALRKKDCDNTVTAGCANDDVTVSFVAAGITAFMSMLWTEKSSPGPASAKSSSELTSKRVAFSFQKWYATQFSHKTALTGPRAASCTRECSTLPETVSMSMTVRLGA